MTDRVSDEPTLRRVFLGSFGVDSGQVIIMDPCYINSEWVRPTDPYGHTGSYGDVMEITTTPPQFGGALVLDNGYPWAVASTTGGDGVFSVYAVMADRNGREYVTRLEIELGEDGREQTDG